MKRSVVVIVVVGVAVIGVAGAMSVYLPQSPGPSLSAPQRVASESKLDKDVPNSGSGMIAMVEAAQAQKYLFAMFYKSDDELTSQMRRTLDAALERVSAKANRVIVKITDPTERSIVEKFGLDRAPMPLILAMAPNGAVTGGFPSKVEEKDLLNAFATPCTEKCMKALQQSKLVFLCVQNASTKSNDSAMQGVRDFQSDSRYSQVTEVISLNPADDAEASFLSDLKIDPKTTEAVTAFMAPPGAVVAEFTGATKKEELVSALEKAGAGSCPGGKCGPGGCGPQK